MDEEQFITEINRYYCSKSSHISQLLSEVRDTMTFIDDFSTLNFGRDTPIIGRKAYEPSVC